MGADSSAALSSQEEAGEKIKLNVGRRQTNVMGQRQRHGGRVQRINRLSGP